MKGAAPSLAEARPDLVAVWAEDRNGRPASEQEVLPVGDPTRAWWRCTRDPEHVFEGAIAYRARHPWRCKHCPHPPPKGRSLLDTHPDLASEWDQQANLPFAPADVRAGSKRQVVWRCPQYPDLHVYTRSVSRRALQGVGCVYCSGFASDQVLNSVSAVAPHLVWEWDYERNTAFPEDVVARSGKKVWWRCPAGHSWEAVVATRTMKGVGCAKCAARHTSIAEALVRSELRTFLPSILAEGRRIDASLVGVTKRTMWPEIDIVVPDLRIAVEYDGSYHHRDRIEQDRRKSELLRRLGWQVIRIRTGDLAPITDLDVAADEPRHQPDPSIPVTVARVLRRVEQITGSVIIGLDDYEQQGAFADPAAADHLIRTMPRPRSRRAVLEVAPRLPPRDAWTSDDFADVVRARRLAYGHTLGEAAAAMGLSALQLRKYEADTARPRLQRTAEALQNYLDLAETTLERLLGRPVPGAGGRAPRPPMPPPTPPDPSTWESLGLGGTLRGLRQSRRQTQSDVAEAVGFHFGALSVWELGTAVPRDPSAISALEDHFAVPRGSLAELIPERDRRLGRRANQAGGGRIAVLDAECSCEQPSPGDLGHLIEHRQLEKSLSQEQLAALLATTQGVVSRWERGDAEPFLESMVRMSAVLGVPLTTILAAHPVYGRSSPFGGLVLAARAEKGMKQEELATLVGCSQATISKWERGASHPWPTQFEAVAAALTLPLETVRSVVPYRRPGPPAGVTTSV